MKTTSIQSPYITVGYIDHRGGHCCEMLRSRTELYAKLAALGRRGLVAEAWIEPDRENVIGYSLPGRTLEDGPLTTAPKDPLPFVHDDGGRAASGFVGKAGDCVTRAIAIATGLPYQQVYDTLAAGTAAERQTKHSRRLSGRRTAREGIHTSRLWFKVFMQSHGWTWTPTMKIGAGCTVHLRRGELPAGRLVVAVSRHYTAVIDGTIHDTHDCGRDGWRCVYGYWRQA
jgi:hypothetical protein